MRVCAAPTAVYDATGGINKTRIGVILTATLVVRVLRSARTAALGI